MTKDRPIQEILRLATRSAHANRCWIETEEHRLIRSECARAIDGSGETVWVHGAKGVGKTHLATRISAEFGMSYYNCREIPKSRVNSFLESVGVNQAVVLDGFDAWLGDPEIEEFLFSWWKQKEACSLIIARASPRLDGLFALPDLASRAVSGMVLSMIGLNDFLLVELFNCQVQEHELDLSPEVLKFLIPRLPRNPALITDLVDSMDRESLRDQRKITIPWVNQRLMPHP